MSPYELVAPPRRSGRYGPAKGSKKKEEDDDGGQTRCVCNQQRTYHSLPFPFTLFITLLPFFPSRPFFAGQFNSLPSCCSQVCRMNFLFIRHGTTTHLSVSLMSSLLFSILVQGGTGQERKRGGQRREKVQKRRKTKAFPQLTSTATSPTPPCKQPTQ